MSGYQTDNTHTLCSGAWAIPPTPLMKGKGNNYYTCSECSRAVNPPTPQDQTQEHLTRSSSDAIDKAVAETAAHFQDQTQADELDKQLDNLLTWDFDGVKEPLIFADPMRTAIKKLVLSYANQRALELLDELIDGYTLSRAGVERALWQNADEEFIALSRLKAKRLNLTKEKS